MASRYFCLICRHPTPGPGEPCPHCQSRQASVEGATPQLLAIVFVAMLALFVGTGYYNRAFNIERRDRAEEHFRLGRTFSDYGYFEGAIDHFGDALLYDRGNFDYRLGLTLALYESGRYQEAELQLRQLRTLDPTQASVNRMLARLARRNGRVEEATQYYRTAIYGRWARNAEQNRIETRLEFVEFLKDRGDNLQLVGELLVLLREESANEDLVRRAGLMLADAGSPAEAVRVLQPAAERDPQDEEVLAALGRSYFATGEYGLARQELRKAVATTPTVELREMLAEAQEVISLDPGYRALRGERRVTQQDRYRRSREVVQRTVDYLESCLNPVGDSRVGPNRPRSEPLRAALGAADLALGEGRRPSDYVAATERNMGIATDLWSFRAEACRNIWNEDDALARVLEGVVR